jgi:hypothetical protein
MPIFLFIFLLIPYGNSKSPKTRVHIDVAFIFALGLDP